MRDRQGRSDRDLLAATATGDRTAFETLYRTHYPRLLGFATRVSGRPDLGEEAVNDTMMTVWRRAGSFEGRSSVSTWMFGIAYRIAARARGRMATRGARTAELDDEMPAEVTGTQQVEAAFERKAVLAALATLPDEQRVTAELAYYHGYTMAEIAEITDTPEGTVKTRLFHARAKLRKALAEDEA